MRISPKLSAIAITAITLLSACIYVGYQKSKVQPARIFPEKKDESQPVSPDILRAINGPPLTEGKEDFEKIILQLLLVSPDDKSGSFGGRHKIDMKAREKYFSLSSYSAYTSYVEQQKRDIISLGEDSGAPYTCRAEFTDNSQKYIRDDSGRTIFSANGGFVCGAWDAFGGYGKYAIQVKTRSDVTRPSSIIIDDWNVEILESVKPKPYVKRPCIKHDGSTPDALLKYELDAQKKHGCI